MVSVRYNSGKKLQINKSPNVIAATIIDYPKKSNNNFLDQEIYIYIFPDNYPAKNKNYTVITNLFIICLQKNIL